jgi:hypothetical protein
VPNFSVLTAVGAALVASEEEKIPVPLPAGRTVKWTLTNRLNGGAGMLSLMRCFTSFGSAKKPAKESGGQFRMGDPIDLTPSPIYKISPSKSRLYCLMDRRTRREHFSSAASQ